MRQLLCFIGLIGLLASPVWAQDSTTAKPAKPKDVIIRSEEEEAEEYPANRVVNRRDTAAYTVPNDRSPVRVRTVDEKLLDGIRTSRDYQYGDELPPTASLWEQFKAWFWTRVNELFQSRGYRSVGRYVMLVTVAALVVWLLYKAEVLTRLFPGRARSLGLDYTTLEEDIHAINFQAQIDEAISQGNHRLAVRLLYLQTLKRLTDRGLIRWQPNKTNRQYAYELTGNPARLGFEQLTTQFEYIWYGDFPVDEARFQTIRQSFNQFNAA